MKGNAQALKIWNTIPNKNKIILLNNVFCGNCNKARGIADATAILDANDLIVTGSCITCGKKCVRLIEITVEKKQSSGSHHTNVNGNNTTVTEEAIARCKRIKKLASYTKNGKFDNDLSNIIPLRLFGNDQPWPLSNYEFFDEDNNLDKEIYAEVLAMGDRPCWEMEQILPGLELYEDGPNDPILDGIEIHEEQGFNAALAHFKELIKIDNRCIDAYAHIGNMYFNLKGGRAHNVAKSYYKQGVAIGLQAIGDRLNDVFPWGMINNRPFLRCIEGFGLCFLKQDKIADALDIFKQMLLLNPIDNQGVRFIISDYLC